MKKIYLLILLVVSMSFAGLKVVGPKTWDDFKNPSFKIINKGGSKVKGFKISAYLETCPQAKGLKITNQELHGGTISWTRLFANLYKIDIDFSKQTIPADGTFPSDGSYVKFSMRNYNAQTSCSSGSEPDDAKLGDRDLSNYVVKDLSGKTLWGKPVKDHGKRRVGVLNRAITCDIKTCEPNEIILDTEDKDANTHIEYGYSSAIEIEKRTSIKFFVKYEYKTPQVPFDYIVLKMDKTCPSGTYEFARYHDTEDNNNQNSFTGDVWPNEIDRNAKLYFCFVPKDKYAEEKYPYKAGVGVFANVDRPNVLTSEIFVDDEDDDNENEWIGLDKLSINIQNRIKNIMRGYDEKDRNTIYHIAVWNGGSLSKSAAKVAESPISAGQPLVAAAPLAPAIKGLDRSAVAVDLKSEGKVKVSIVNVNGSVIANIAQESLQPGIHQIKWNSGMVPSGRYIVKIEQNGMVNAKNVILK